MQHVLLLLLIFVLQVLSPQTTYITALGVPEYLGQPDLPLLITEDDVVFTTEFNAKLSDVSGTVRCVMSVYAFVCVYVCACVCVRTCAFVCACLFS
jgi:hypothetical protein